MSEQLPFFELLAEFKAQGIGVQVTRSLRRDPIHIIEPAKTYRLILCVTLRPPDARACYIDVWNKGRFEPLGDITLLPPNYRLQIRGDRTRQVSIVCHLAGRLIEQWLEGEAHWSDRRLTSSLHVSQPHIRALLMRLGEEAHRPELGSEAVARFIGGQLGIEIARFYNTITEERAAGGLAPWRLRLIDERLKDLTQMPSVEELAGLCSLSVRQLSRGFRASRGVSVREYCNEVRIERAKRLLAGDGPIKAVAHATGYATPTTFTQAFRLATGSSPREYRQRMRQATIRSASPTSLLPD